MQFSLMAFHSGNLIRFSFTGKLIIDEGRFYCDVIRTKQKIRTEEQVLKTRQK